MSFWNKLGRKGDGDALLRDSQNQLRDAICDDKLQDVQNIVSKNPTVAEWLNTSKKWKTGCAVWGWPSAPLHHAAVDNRSQIIEYLVRGAGINVNSYLKFQSGATATALHLAILEGCIASAEVLLSLGADPKLKASWDRYNGTARQWALRAQKDKEIGKFAGGPDPFGPILQLLPPPEKK